MLWGIMYILTLRKFIRAIVSKLLEMGYNTCVSVYEEEEDDDNDDDDNDDDE